MNRTTLCLLLAAACVGSPTGPHVPAPGSFVEAKGRIVDGAPVVEEIDELVRGTDDKDDKVEVTGPVAAADADRVRLFDHDFARTEQTTYEDADKNALAPFTPAAGEWLRVKARDEGADGHRARLLRRVEARDQFKVTGALRAFDPAARVLDVGGIGLPLAQDADVTLLGQRDADDPLALFLADDQKAVPFTLRAGDTLRFGGQFALEDEWDDEFDLDTTRNGDRVKPAWRGKLDALWLFDDAGSYALAEVGFGRSEVHREGGADTKDDVAELTRAFASVRLGERWQLLVGRQDFDEEREWLYDEVLDGVRLVYRGDDHDVEVAAARGRDFLAENNPTEHTGLFVANARWHLDGDWTLGAYALQRTDGTAADFEPLLYGVRSFAMPRHGLGHWLELGGAAGSAGGRDVRGYAFDVGAIYAFDAAWRPTLAAGLAFGSGAPDGAGHQGYRQSGLQDDNGKLGGVTSVRYYGELFDPELANLAVATLAVAVRPATGLSLSLLLHEYRQDTAATTAPDTGLRTAPNGSSRDLGRELDFVAGYRLQGRMTLEFVAARFWPGDAFTGDDAANLLAVTARFGF
ncbi:MAG: alginate export family protein [Planctomycetota bacterium]